ncbi:MAG TPA: hypothetical protein DCS07_07675 [Bdellovibrionales bacterium]|nr:MAG: hypothetical protein A2Z97_12935 [Bdellovibrionales bacterium GWB1_52_6]OFZ05738.1 MAG: hypothetical protein A2X97_03490 [Bdellovibrionales bacterium GWA1_52_35]OFZ35574.1 MAG: hypothetical protein A2070_09645 [Bdellovibrionales bacterium GWC1_52_8]HAR42496.1 hypothetical protein [Bdellovibrionales bacterium]HCM40322.1 hypothetical protein [Bdellovibrionales bacterium]
MSSAPDNKKQNNRRVWWNLWIYPKFQGMLLTINVLSLALVFLLIGFMTNRSYEQLKEQGILSQLQPSHPYFQFLNLQYKLFRSHLVFAFFSSAILISLATLFLSHRLAGPVVRMKGYFKRLSEKGYTGEKVSFRTADFFSELPDLINAAVEKLIKR